MVGGVVGRRRRRGFAIVIAIAEVHGVFCSVVRWIECCSVFGSGLSGMVVLVGMGWRMAVCLREVAF